MSTREIKLAKSIKGNADFSISYKVEDTHCVITEYTIFLRDEVDTEFDTIIFPAEIDGLPVTEISCYADTSNREKLWRETTIDENEGTICDLPITHKIHIKIKELIIPDTVESISADCFSRANHLNKVVWPANCTIIPESCFFSSSLTEIVIPEGVTEIAEQAFSCTWLKSVTIPVSCVKFGVRAFTLSTSLKEINILNKTSKLTIEEYAFSGIGAEEFTWPENCPEIPPLSFVGNIALKKLIIKGPIKKINTPLFTLAENLECIDFSGLEGICHVPIGFFSHITSEGFQIVKIIPPTKGIIEESLTEGPCKIDVYPLL